MHNSCIAMLSAMVSLGQIRIRAHTPFFLIYVQRFIPTAHTECDRNLCQNGGSCSLLTSTYTCVCPPGYGGSLCEVEYPSICYPSCENGGSCITNNTCICPLGFTGDRCAEPGSHGCINYTIATYIQPTVVGNYLALHNNAFLQHRTQVSCANVHPYRPEEAIDLRGW